MTTIEITCASPSCAASIELDRFPRPGDGIIESLGWRWEAQRGDDRLRAYCPRDVRSQR